MKDKIKSTEINVNKENIIPIADVKQESQCVLTLELYKDNVAFDITGQTVKLGAKTADGNVQLQESGFTTNKNILTVDLKSSINSVVGLVEIDLTFTDSTGIMTTSSFYLNVIKKTLGKDNIIASNQLEAVKVLIEDLKTKGNNTIADIKKDYDSLKKVIIDNNVAANLQVQINGNKQQLVENNNNISELNTKLTENKNDIDYLDSKITTNTNNITTLNSKVTTNTDSINNLKTELAKHNIQTNPLWEGASFLAAGQELTLNKSLDNCRNGVVLVWSQYNTSTDEAINERFAFVFIRKNTIVQNLNKSFGCLIANAGDRVSSYDHIITKYVNVSGTRVVGWSGNNQYQNAQSVLRAVYEW